MDVWKELKQRAEGEDEPLRSTKSSKNGSGGAAKQEDEKDIWETGFTLNDLSASVMRLWLGLQVVGLLFQASLWQEVSGHLSEYAGAVARECADGPVHGVCVGPSWNVTSWQDVVLSSGHATASKQGTNVHVEHGGSSHSFSFKTKSMPPTFLIAVDPVTQAAKEGQAPEEAKSLANDDDDLKGAHWSLEVTRTNPTQSGPNFHKFAVGQKAMTIEDLSVEAREAIAKREHVDWWATLYSRQSHPPTRFIVFVEDATSAHLAQIHGGGGCTFGRAWKAFNEQHQGRSHRALAWSSWLLGWFLLASGAVVYAVYRECEADRRSGFKYRFHLIVFAKFLLQDVPMQICIVLYVIGWYEADGLRCQLCLFDPAKCGVEHPFHFFNAVAFACVLLSSVANQLLVRPVFKRTYTEDDICLQYSVRVGGACISTLAFTSGLCYASGSILSMSTVLHVLVAVPCGIGWLALTGLVTFPIMLCCDEDC